MSKSRGNVINPDDVVGEQGSDALRLYEMFTTCIVLNNAELRFASIPKSIVFFPFLYIYSYATNVLSIRSYLLTRI